MPEGTASGQSRVLARTSMAAGMVPKGLRLLSTVYERNDEGEESQRFRHRNGGMHVLYRR